MYPARRLASLTEKGGRLLPLTCGSMLLQRHSKIPPSIKVGTCAPDHCVVACTRAVQFRHANAASMGMLETVEQSEGMHQHCEVEPVHIPSASAVACACDRSHMKSVPTRHTLFLFVTFPPHFAADSLPPVDPSLPRLTITSAT